jgi:serine/threonine protein phosphatase PrpC/tetratricopeptide (TPR) repeat protein
MSENITEKLILQYSGRSDIGMVRSENQDSFGKFPENDLDLYSEKGQLFIVADGVGGHTGGKEASRMAVNIIGDIYFNSDSPNKNSLLKEAIEEANFRIYKKASGSTEFTRMATTCSTLLLKENTGTIGHVGDSRVYKIENDSIEQLTRDHTQVQEMLREGILTDKEAENYPSKSVLARAVGADEKVKVDLIENVPLRKGQIFVMCSDGLGKVSPDEILNIVPRNSPGKSCETLIGLANERGGKDNITVLIIKVDKSPDKIDSGHVVIPSKTKKKKNSILPIIFLSVILIVLVLVIFRKSIFSIYSTDKIEKSDTIQTTGAQKEINESAGSGNELIDVANNFFSQGKIESALKTYKKILDKDPMHLEALNGITKIADYYFEKAEKYRNSGNFKEALSLYSKVKELQPDNEKIDEFILICNNQIQNSTSKPVAESEENNSSEIIVPKNKDISVSNFVTGDWDFLNSNSGQYNIDEEGIEFSNSSTEQKTVYSPVLNNASVSIDIKLYYFKGNSRVGIIIGYEPPSSGNSENYFLFTLQNENNYVLQKISGNNVQRLLFLYPNDLRSDPEECHLKIKCFDNVISIYNEGRLLSSYQNADRVTGRVGFFADKNVSAKFYNLSIIGTIAEK